METYITVDGRKGWRKELLHKVITYEEVGEGIQRYKDGKPMGTMGGSGLYKRGTSGYYALKARLNAEVEGVRHHFRVWTNAGALYEKYITLGDYTCLDRLNEHLPDFVRWLEE